MANENNDQDTQSDADGEKKSEYESSREPGDKVRVARMTGDLDEPVKKEAETGPDAAVDADGGDEGDDQPQEGSYGVTVRGKGEVQKKAEPSKDDAQQASREQGSGQDGETSQKDASQTDTSQTEAQSSKKPASELTEEELRERAAREVGEKMDADSADFEMDEAEVDKQLGAGAEDATTEDFAAMFEGNAQSQPQRRDFSAGDRVQGEILSIGQYNIFVQLGPQTEGIAKRRAFENDEGELEVEEGDTEEFYVLRVTEDEIQLGEELDGNDGSLEAVKEAHDSGVPIKGKVTGTNKGGFEVTVHGVDAFCPISQIELGFTEDKEQHVGKTYRFKVSEVRDGGDSVVVSRAELLREERKQKAKEAMEKLEEGQVVTGVVTRTTGFGAFVELGGVEGLIHISELSHRHFDHADDVVSEGEEVEVEVLKIEEADEEGEDPRIGLSRKATERDPWEVVNEEFKVGQTVQGTVSRNAPFGSFVEIAEGVDGLVHVSEMSWTEHVRTPDEVVDPGDTVTVEIQDIDLAKRRISLSMKAAEGNPWDSVQQDYAEGMQVEGTVENIEDFGAFVKLGTGITALIPRSEMDLPDGVTPHRKYNPGDTVSARVLNIEPGEQRMALTTKEQDEPIGDSDAGDSQQGGGQRQAHQQSSQQSSQSAKTGSGGSFGTLGDLIGDDLQDED